MDAAWRASVAQWEAAGGSVLLRRGRCASEVAEASRDAFATLQTAAALDADAASLRAQLSTAQSSGTSARPTAATGCADEESDDNVDDGSSVQASLIARNVREGKPSEPMGAGLHAAPDGSPRLVSPGLLTAEECSLLVGGGLVMMAGAFSRCGQTTLGVSPALGGRMLHVARRRQAPGAGESAAEGGSAGESTLGGTLPLLYVSVERARRRVAETFGVPLSSVRNSDATFTRLLPYGNAEAPVGVDYGGVDAGAMRGEKFCYWRPHIDQARRSVPYGQ